MKRYEMLKIDISTPEAAITNLTAFCSCPPKTPCIVDCAKCRADYLLEEIPTKKVQRGTQYQDFMKAYKDFEKVCEGLMGKKEICPSNCKYAKKIDGRFNCFMRYLEEEIEVPIE